MLTVMLMTLVIVSLGGLAVLWSMGSVSESRNVYGLVFEQKIERTKERLLIENVEFKLATQQVEIYIRNIGAIPVTVDHVYINGELILVSNPEEIDLEEGKTITVGDDEELPFTIEEGELIK